MAKLDLYIPDDLILKLQELGDRTEEIITKMLDAGGPIAAASVKSELERVVGKAEDSKATGELVRSIGATPPRPGKDGYNVKIGFSEPRGGQNPGDGVNAKVAYLLEYGRRDKSQKPRPFLRAGKRNCERQVQQAMAAVYKEEMKKV